MWCQVIKSDDRMCKNYARKGMVCCYSHRKLEFVESEPISSSESINSSSLNEIDSDEEISMEQRYLELEQILLSC